MPATRLQRHVPHSPEDLMDLVVDVERYPEFISMISALRKTKGNKEKFEAEAVIAYKFLSETFRSLVEINLTTRQISVVKSDRAGAVKSLKNKWKFYPLSDGSTLIDFEVDVRLKALPLEILAREKFPKVASKIMDMFLDEASRRYEKLSSNIDVLAEAKALGLRVDSLA